MKWEVSYMRIALSLLFLVSLPVMAGIIEHQAKRTLPGMGKTVFMFGEEHTDPFDPAAVAQREELALSIDAIGNEHEGPISCYLECDNNVQKSLQKTPYFYARNVIDHGAYFEQWYVPLARTFGQEVAVGRMAISNFDIRDHQYAHFEHHLQALADGDITHDQVNFQALQSWGNAVDDTIQQLFEGIQARYPQKMISYIKRDMERKKKQFHAMIDKQLHSKKRARYTYRALNQFYNYTDLLADFTILNKVANDPRGIIVINAGSAHTENLSSYFNNC
jgi:hypothetical protein